MEKSQELDPFWNWIPAFRAVAEHQNLSSAAVALGQSRSALSRTIRLLEDSIGRELFRRSGRALSLNREGEAFLRAVRLGMRVIHEGVTQLQSPEPSGRLVISCTGPCLHLLEPVLRESPTRWPQLSIEVKCVPSPEVATCLRRGEIDLALLADAYSDEETQLELLSQLEYGIFCGRQHPLFEQAEIEPAQILEYPFVAPHTEAGAGDPWPVSLDREVGLRVHQLSLAIEVCANGEFLGVFPRHSAGSCQRELRELPCEWISPHNAYAVRRSDVAENMPAALVVARIREVLEGFESRTIRQ